MAPTPRRASPPISMSGKEHCGPGDDGVRLAHPDQRASRRAAHLRRYSRSAGCRHRRWPGFPVPKTPTRPFLGARLSHGITSIIFGFAGNRIGGFYMTAGLHITCRYHGQLYAIDAWSASTNCVIRNWRDNVNPGRATAQATSTTALPSTSRASVNEWLYRAVVVAGLAQSESTRLTPLRIGGVA